MSQDIRYHKEFVLSTIVSQFPESRVVVESVGSGPIAQNFTKPAGTLKRSSRDGRLPRRVERSIREDHDPEFKDRLIRARQIWAEEAYPDAPQSLAKMRLQKGLSQTQLADLIGTSQSHIAKIEAGQVRIYLDTANRLAVALSVSLDKLNALLDSTSAESSSKVA
ncbi:hypothetical protein BBB39_12920 [Bordetella trematum]|uniref:Anaerobic benzoate catabolism transcriptional regulator n=1 Tax=Bordetella trematum TaxID=123899 RepID=A0A146A6S0_9BORD|nr:helix-turn-helix transcriptional regulator [Bordetella trematum]AZR94578.1 hypothetical protein BBB39_12920 [Bordetella trematum]CZZ83845.1 anaerobic benzoate catabolism transcriptional regulator [Bordetella trematum]SAI73814.1 anaerobic benzoate catabolism transcriptional regulator [Bordetella trematum]SUV97184.1 anaerobic benzoate catabolism transcriptional regulator [Bordetella trematum]